jgi:UDP-N-acetylglucosamine:LPS N-acetylglucosamine transferase
VVLLSGPEPQRSILEEIIIREISHYNHTATVVRGLPGERSIVPSTNMIKFYNHLPAQELNQVIDEAEYVISRSGYSTVMDLVKLQKKSILIPTPGQTEQQYLGKYLMEKKIALCVQQKDFSLSPLMEAAMAFDYNLPVITGNGELKKTIDEFLALLRLYSLNH